jgi:hypothetical protein
MQYVSCTVVMHEGKFRVQKNAISVPEIVLLRRLHGGDDAVLNIRPQHWKRVSSFRAEKQRLMAIYGRKETTAKLIDELFPGEFPRLPTSLRDIATGNPVLDGEDGADAGSYDDAPAPKRGKANGKGETTPPKPVVVTVPKEEPDEIRIPGEDEEDGDAPVELADQSDEPEDYSFLNDKSGDAAKE